MSEALWLVATAYRLVYGVLDSYIAARLAADRPMFYALWLGAIGPVGMVLSIAGVVATWN